MTANGAKDVGFFTGIVLSVLRYPPEAADPEGSTQSIRVVSISPRYLAYRIVKLWLRLLAAFAVEETLLHTTLKGPVPFYAKVAIFLLIVGIPGAIGSFVTFVEYTVRSYKLSDRSLRIREGLLFVRETTMTFANVQNVSVSRGPLQGLFGISDLVMKTAGGGGGGERHRGLRPDLHVAHFHGLRDADEVRERVLALLEKTKGTGVEPAHEWSEASAAAGPALVDALTDVQRAAAAFRVAAERLPPRA